MADANNDDLRCRWADLNKNECAGVCQSVPPATLWYTSSISQSYCYLGFDGVSATAGKFFFVFNSETSTAKF